MKSELEHLAKVFGVWMPYRSEARPDTALDSTTFTQPIADTLPQIYHYRPHVLDLTQALDNTIHRTVVFWSQEHAGGLKSLVDNI